jgi:ribonuclease R
MHKHTHTHTHHQAVKTATGMIRAVRGKIAYFIADKSPIEAEISTRLLRTAMSGDKVEVQLYKKTKSGLYDGEVVKVLERAKTQFVGTIKEENGEYIFIPDDKKLKSPVKIPHDKIRNGKNNEKVKVKITTWKSWPDYSLAEVLNVLGRAGDNSTEMNSIAIDKGFEIEFPEKVLEESTKIFKENKTISQEEIEKRRDFRQTFTCTIDPKTAKDFDDAISFERLTNGHFEIGIHIADVSHYVREKSELDTEAYRRGCSVYLPDRTIPMLPFELSDELCSLNEHEEKLSFSAVFEMDMHGKIYSRWFGKTVIKSAKRFTYENAQEILNKGEGEYFETLDTLNKIAKVLRKEKWQKGAIDFEQEEIAFELDEEGRPIRIYKKQRLDTHKLVEEYMLLANKEVAEYVYKYEKKSGKVFPIPYRIHDFPDPEKIQELSIFVKALGHNLVIGKDGSVTGRDMQALFAQVEGKAEEALVKTAAIRSMAKAVYSIKNIGHFGLAFEYYAHFTSPIRRYPDLLVQRILEKALHDEKLANDQFAFYEKAAMHSTDQEIKAAEAERDSRKYKQIEFMKDKVGKTFDGLITGVTEWGIYAEDTETKAEGMIRLATLTDDFYVLDPKHYAIVGEKTKKKYQLGQKIRIKLVSADLERRIMDWEIVG